ncbi:tRNA 2-thiouridine(34) synthase MnmA [Blattabacterium cuenoti]|uniref:tRNA 2-thiouridine(34) synthase MnmA n=1 Tax=Blattabacterium cuenoti TaxID=1653831 RepID=UPI00163BAFB1|nr:tRNA 2-thiouridine(34) synthase MnmA [Blattabacterium cuenoti]
MYKYKVVVALSGGVDSSVAALILKKQGYNVIGLFINTWDNHDDDCNMLTCNWKEDSIYAMLVANKLNIPFQIIEMKNEYKQNIINYMFKGYKSGITPNPDIMCNSKIKFDCFLKQAMNLGADFIATGHYVNKQYIIKNNKIIYRLLIGTDSNKDQSYFLCQLKQYQLSKSIFPLGKLTKKEVRQIANKSGLCNADKKDSQGLCFLGKINLYQFLQQKIPKKTGEIINIDSNASCIDNHNNINRQPKYCKSDGKIIGYHNGYQFFTKGQRKGLSIGGLKHPIFVIETDIKHNIVYTGMGRQHPGLYDKSLFIKQKNIHWIRDDYTMLDGDIMKVLCRTRYRQPLQQAILNKIPNGMLIEFKTMQFAITKGQFAAWYINKELIGSGIIS